MIDWQRITGFQWDPGNAFASRRNKRDMPYQSLIKVWLAEDVERNQR